MNRRHKKPQQTDYLAKVQNYWQQLDWPRYRQQLHALWLRLPPFHRRGLMVLTPAVLVLMVIPLPDKQDVAAETPATSKRIEVGINTQSLSEQRTQAQTALKSSAWQEYVVRQGILCPRCFVTTSYHSLILMRWLRWKVLINR